ncbi:DNA-directed DNA polymerase, family B, conserved site [Penicillium camemberti]|uniref:DNA-directed DNA polymerase, family B, conserved site n=1 Tax=Penicillium camemberti (strain FM 013) TaxID=1429867 RepID=A0A0G4NXB5_PENC3|nr:DNA-directed DNA polymerase, family B, conserved site [Penicillium camemberti]
MGRQAYLNRLALGRSPYEAPDNAAVDPSTPVRRISNVHADDYMQQYDTRGHPVNPESRTLGKELRRAKNDILSTMGIVVSGEDRNSTIPNEQQKINQIASENDFGLVITTLDQLFIFFGTWWTSSVTGRVQTYRHYAHSALLGVIQSERDTAGILNFYFSGIPAWAMSSGLAIARETPLKRVFVSLRDYVQSLTGDSLGVRSLFGLLYTGARNAVLMLSMEFYMYSTLQSLSLVSPYGIPGAHLLLPFSRGSLLQLPPLPTDFSPHSLGNTLVQLLISPGVLVFLYGYYLRPELEERIYRLIRRHLPKPALPDELSVRVAFEENLIEWVVPTLGRRSDEELYRSSLPLLEDIKFELATFRRWVSSLFGLRSNQLSEKQALQSFSDERIQNLRNSIELLQNELDGVQHTPDGEEGPNDPVPRPPGITPDAQVSALASRERPRPGEASRPTHLTQAESVIGLNQVLTNENPTAGQTSRLSTTSTPQDQTAPLQNGEDFATDRQSSRSNTLFSRSSSPETSPPTSPRVRASLIHQSSDVITMQLELMGNRNRHPQIQPPNPAQLDALARNNVPGSNTNPDTMDRRSIAEFLEALILSQAQRQAQQPLAAADTDGLSSITAGPSNATPQDLGVPELDPQIPAPETQATDAPTLESIEEALGSIVPNILPDGVEEPNDEEPSNENPIPDADHNEDTHSDTLVQPILPSSLIPGQLTNTLSQVHRVTLLSAYPVDSLASHLAAAISGIILAPLEALYLRSLTRSWIISHPSSVTRLSDIHPLGLWFGGRTWPDIWAYSCRLVLMRGMQVAMRAGIWGFLVGSTMRIGRNFCGWGTL